MRIWRSLWFVQGLAVFNALAIGIDIARFFWINLGLNASTFLVTQWAAIQIWKLQRET